MPFVMDEKDKKIVKILSRNPRVTQAQLAEMLGISQPAVSMRISRLRERGLLKIQIGADPKKARLSLAKVEIKARDVEFLNDLAKCPYIVCASTSTGKFNVFLMMGGEDHRTLEAIVNKHIRKLPGVDEIEFNIILDHYGKLLIPIKVVEEYEDLPSCAKKLLEENGCEHCIYYQRGHCLGCPYLKSYRGYLFKVEVDRKKSGDLD